MRGELCVGFASLVTFTATLLLIFVHVGQINTSSVPKGISMAKVNVSNYGAALHNATFDPIQALYATNASAPLGVSAGLRQLYEFGLYSNCAYLTTNNTKQGLCSNQTIGRQFRPYDTIRSDMIANYSTLSDALIIDTTFRDSTYLGHSSKAAYWMLLLGTICSALALLSGIAVNHFTFFLSSIFSFLSCLFILISASIWTVLIKRSESVNSIIIGSANNPVPIGIAVSAGTGLFLSWAAFACLVVGFVPYMIICCTYRG